MKVILVCSTGGHFLAMQRLYPFWRNHQRIWVTFYSENTKTTLDAETVYWAWNPTNRNLINLVRNVFLAWQILSQETPNLVISTGAGVAVPFLILAKLLGSQTVFIESITRVKQLSLSAKLALPFLDTLYVHWPQLQARHPKAEIIGY
jgi:UDP-N-acetylglucosamine:LPS N-acetylglucosamine transferase